MGIKPFWDTHHIVLQCIITIVKTTIIAAWDRQAAPRLRTCFSHAWAGKFNRLPILQMELLAAPGFRPLHFAIWTFLNHMTTISQGNQPPLHPKPQRDWGFSAARTWHPQSFASLVVFGYGFWWKPKKHQIAWAFMIFQTNDQTNYKIWHDMTIYDHKWPMFKIHYWHNHDYHHHVTHPYMSLDVLPEPSSPNQVMSTRVPVAHPQHPVLCSYLYLSVYLISCFIALWGYMQVQTKTN